MAVGVLRKETAGKLAAANKEFQEKGYRIKVWDGYRPPYVQKIFWEIMPDDRYVANPYKGGSRHNRGGAVDVTLIDQNDKELEMPSAYDDFSSKAWRNNFAASAQARKNTEYLTKIMMKHGFTTIAHEWWHFDDADYKNFPLVDVKLERFLASTITEKIPAPLVVMEIPSALVELPQETKQVVVVKTSQDESFQAQLTAWERSGKGWKAVFPPMPVVIGRNSFAAKGHKQEGDGRTPSGVFKFGTVFGYDPWVPTQARYHQLTDDDIWVDDPASPEYNRWSSKKRTEAKSFEVMRRKDDLYKYGAVIEYNRDPVVPGKGSAIFMHVWRGPDSPTAGCVAMSEENILKFFKWLDKDSNPVIILGNK